MGYNYDLSTGWWWLEHDITWLFFVHEQVGMSSSQLTFIFFQRGWNHQADIVLYMFVYSLLHRMVKMTLLCLYTFGPDPLYGVLEANYWVIGWLNYWVTEWLDDWMAARLVNVSFLSPRNCRGRLLGFEFSETYTNSKHHMVDYVYPRCHNPDEISINENKQS